MGAATDASYFLSWGWIAHWLESLPADAQVRLAVVSERGLPMLGCFLGESRISRHRLLGSHGVFLNATGYPGYDDLSIEYNGFLAPRSSRYALKEILELLPQPWEEFFMPGLDAEQFPGNCLHQSLDPYHVVIEQDVPAPYVDLELVRQRGGDYLSLLSARTRAHIRRSYRGFEAMGRVGLEAAGTVERAMEIFEEMVGLHQRAWSARGQPGAFASRYFHDFHAGLIRRRMAHGEIQLLRVSAGDATLGCLYNFVFKGRVYFYQSGLNYEIQKRLHPGLVSLTEAVLYNARQGQALFDLMGGKGAYKSTLGTHARRLLWAKIQKPRVKFRVERALRTVKRSVWGLRATAHAGEDAGAA